MKEYARESRPWAIWLTFAAVILAGIGIFFYYTLFRQSKSELIEAVPTDAAFLFVINDNDAFVSGNQPLTPYTNELFVMDALPAFETMRSKLPAGDYDLTVSGHSEGDGLCLLFNMHADKAAFKRLLRALSIDPNNYTPFENNRIYTYGTNYKSVKFVYVNHIISFSTNIDLLKRAIVQHTHPKNLLSGNSFKEVYDLIEKNRKQNWVVLKSKEYLPYLSTFLNNKTAQKVTKSLSKVEWAAFQLRFSGKDLHMSGYMLMDPSQNNLYELLLQKTHSGMEINDLYPSDINWYTYLETPNFRDLSQIAKESSSNKTPYVNFNPSEVGYFSMGSDSLEYRYTVLLTNSSKNISEALFGEKADSAQAAHPDGVYFIPNSFPALLNNTTDSANYFIISENTIVMSSTPEALKAYQKSMKNGGNIKQNRLYPFVDEAVASSSLLNFVLFNSENTDYWKSKLSDKGKASQFGQDLHIFSISCETMEKGKNLIPVNLYLHF